MSNEKIITVKTEGGEVKVKIRKPNALDYRESQIEYNKAWRSATESGAYLREKLNDYLIKEGIWSDEKQKKYEKYASEINSKELLLKKGGMPLKKARNIAVEIKRLRNEFRDLISERITYDNNTVEGQAENARFDAFVVSCSTYADTGQKVFSSTEDYNLKSTEQIAIQVATELANLIYNLEASLEDNFLSKYKLVNSDGKLVNKDNHLIAIGLDGEERLIDEEGNYIKYDENGEKYFVNYGGEKVEHKSSDAFAPFTDDDGNPLDESGNPVVSEKSEVAESTEEKPLKKIKKKAD